MTDVSDPAHRGSDCAPAAGTAAGLHGAGGALPVRADRGDDRLQLQRPGRTAEHHLAGLHASQLRRPVGSLADHRTRWSISLAVAAVSTVVATAFGTMIGLALTRYALPRPGALMNLLIFIPMTAPEIILGASLLTLWVEPRRRARLPDHPGRAHHVQHQLRGGHRPRAPGRVQPIPGGGRHGPLCRRPDRPSGRSRSRSSSRASSSAALLAFALSIDDYVITLFSAGHTQTFPLWVFGVSRARHPARGQRARHAHLPGRARIHRRPALEPAARGGRQAGGRARNELPDRRGSASRWRLALGASSLGAAGARPSRSEATDAIGCTPRPTSSSCEACGACARSTSSMRRASAASCATRVANAARRRATGGRPAPAPPPPGARTQPPRRGGGLEPVRQLHLVPGARRLRRQRRHPAAPDRNLRNDARRLFRGPETRLAATGSMRGRRAPGAERGRSTRSGSSSSPAGRASSSRSSSSSPPAPPAMAPMRTPARSSCTCSPAR